ncbi:hypothetical protein K490DRAFT_67259 [Saccharata proteae CBS 121410]|uniref:Uncharacterized protein n=1 Tax=Saccharata proteae CBS 121410 TaxID=1314787 RepID=A0A9P4HSC4_9PEZI|nr:hypothetical protein K490DRAFT_67259 [Saccharata proteae CBS 121410]
MTNLAPPISRDGFIYHGALYVDAGNLNRHPRASLDELTALLRPEKSSAPAAKDQVGHWYVAQLKHYGLPTTKDKNAAKIRLLNALNSGDLKVPADVKKIESAMKKEYDAENRKAKAAAKAAEGAGSTKASAPKKENDAENRKAKAAAKATEAGGSKIASAPKKATGSKRKHDETPVTGASTSMPSADLCRPIAIAVGTKGQRQTAKKTTGSAAPLAIESKTSAKKTTGNAAPLAIAPKTPAKSKSIAQLREEERNEKNAKRDGIKKVRKLHADSKGDRHDDDYDPWHQHDIDSDTISDTEWSNKRKQSGVYTVTVSGNGSDWQSVRYDGSPNELIFCKDGDRMWGSYKFDVYEGMILMDPGPKREIQGLLFQWRGRSQIRPGIWEDTTGRGEMLFEEANVVKGTFFNLKNWRYEFSAKRKTGLAGTSRRGGKSYETEWTALGQANDWSGPAPIQIPAGEKPPRLGGWARRGRGGSIQSGPRSVASRAPKRVKDEHPESMDIDYDASSDPNLLAQISGRYSVDCRDISSTWPWNTDNMELDLCVDGDRLWGSFSWGPFDGVIQMYPGPTKFCPTTSLSFGWRVRENTTGDLRFGRGCTGNMTFYGGGRVSGELFGLHGQSVAFEAEKMDGSHSAGWRSFEQEWNGFVEETYGDYNRNRGWR